MLFSFRQPRSYTIAFVGGRVMAPSETFVALQGLAKKRKTEFPVAPGGPDSAPPREGAGKEVADSSAKKQVLKVDETNDNEGEGLDSDDVVSVAALDALNHVLVYLPSFQTLIKKYKLFRGNDVDEGGKHCAPIVNERGEIFCKCAECVSWRAVVDGEAPLSINMTDKGSGTKLKPKKHYEVFTKEHVGRLAAYFKRRRLSILRRGCSSEESHSRRLRVLELGAGDGTLRQSLEDATLVLDEMEEDYKPSIDGKPSSLNPEPANPSVVYTAVDVSSASSEILELDAVSAVRDKSISGGFPPDVVLVCWHPMGMDWTHEIRKVPSVVEYVMVGETDCGICGKPWDTWGYVGDDFGDAQDCDDGRDDGGDIGDIPKKVPPTPSAPLYALDGFTRHPLPNMSNFQIGKTDEPWRKKRGSATVSFRRT